MVFYDGGSQLGTILPLKGHLAMSGDIFICHCRGKGYYWHLVGRARMLVSTLQCPHRTALTTKNDPAQNVNSAEAEKLIYDNTTQWALHS